MSNDYLQEINRVRCNNGCCVSESGECAINILDEFINDDKKLKKIYKLIQTYKVNKWGFKTFKPNTLWIMFCSTSEEFKLIIEISNDNLLIPITLKWYGVKRTNDIDKLKWYD